MFISDQYQIDTYTANTQTQGAGNINQDQQVKSGERWLHCCSCLGDTIILLQTTKIRLKVKSWIFWLSFISGNLYLLDLKLGTAWSPESYSRPFPEHKWRPPPEAAGNTRACSKFEVRLTHSAKQAANCALHRVRPAFDKVWTSSKAVPASARSPWKICYRVWVSSIGKAELNSIAISIV